MRGKYANKTETYGLFCVFFHVNFLSVTLKLWSLALALAFALALSDGFFQVLGLGFVSVVLGFAFQVLFNITGE